MNQQEEYEHIEQCALNAYTDNDIHLCNFLN